LKKPPPANYHGGGSYAGRGANMQTMSLDPTEASSDQWLYAAGGAVVGAGAGYVIGKKRGSAKKGALIGLVAGGAGGFLAGHFMGA
jgi:hypothetical protein